MRQSGRDNGEAAGAGMAWSVGRQWAGVALESSREAAWEAWRAGKYE